MIPMLTRYLSDLILGEFKWTLLGSGLTLLAMFSAQLLHRWHKRRWLAAVTAGVLIALFLWVGHEMIDPYFHAAAAWWVTPLAEPMHLEVR